MQRASNTNGYERSTDHRPRKSANCYNTLLTFYEWPRSATKANSKKSMKKASNNNTHTNDRLVGKANKNAMANNKMVHQTAKGLEVIKIYAYIFICLYDHKVHWLCAATRRTVASSQRHLFAGQHTQCIYTRPLRRGLAVFNQDMLLRLSVRTHCWLYYFPIFFHHSLALRSYCQSFDLPGRAWFNSRTYNLFAQWVMKLPLE